MNETTQPAVAGPVEPTVRPAAWMWDQAQWREGDVRGRGWYPALGKTHPGMPWMTSNVKALYTAEDVRYMLEGAWCAGYYHAGYTHDSAYAEKQAEKCADEFLGPNTRLDDTAAAIDAARGAQGESK